MAATFIVEDGTGLSNANSYASVADADQYHENNGNPTAWSGATAAVKQNALREGTRILDNWYRLRWKGRRLSRDQALLWPRAYVEDEDRFAVDSDIVPIIVADVTAYMGLQIVNGDDPLAGQDNPGAVKSESVQVGSIRKSTVYTGGNPPRKRYPEVTKRLAGLLTASDLVLRG